MKMAEQALLKKKSNSLKDIRKSASFTSPPVEDVEGDHPEEGQEEAKEEDDLFEAPKIEEESTVNLLMQKKKGGKKMVIKQRNK
jgi:hypothetical protein